MFSFLKKLFEKQNKPLQAKLVLKDPAHSLKSETQKKQTKPPSKNQILQCQRLGLKITPEMSSREVWQKVQEALKIPELKAIEDAYIQEQNRLFEQEERAEYGDALIDERNKWESYCKPGQQYFITYKKGKTTRSDLIEFERAEISETAKPYIQLEALLPKIHKPRGEDPYFELEKEIILKPNQIIELRKLDPPIDMFNVEQYEKTISTESQC